MKKYTPRRYQERAVDNFSSWMTSAEKLGTIILPTGTGKTATTIMAINKFIKEQPLKILWAAHREELINQAKNEFLNIIPDANIEIEMAEQRASNKADIIVGSVQTLYRNRKNIQGFNPDLVVVDEWHHYDDDNKTYNGLMERYTNAKFLGLTATPYRASGNILPLGHKLIEMDIGVAVAHNYLVPPKPEILKTNVSLANVRTRAGDFAIDDLSAAVNVSDRNQLIAKRIIELVKEEKRQGILFGVDVAHSKAMADILKKEVRVAEIYGETDKEERRDLMKRVYGGEIDVVTNNLVLTEGTDLPHMSFICVARPTKSKGLAIQMIGRGLRLYEGKNDCVIVDVFDKVKTTQKRITFSDIAAATDIDGSQRRISAILTEKLPDKLKNFPIFLTDSLGHWTVDNESWSIPSWILAPNHWVITWTKRETREETNSYEYISFNHTPSKYSLEKNPIQIGHSTLGDGLMISINDDLVFPKATVIFGDKKIDIPFCELTKKSKSFERKKLDNPIKRAFYICIDSENNKGRLISLTQENERSDLFKIDGDFVGDKTTLDEMIKVAAEQDDMFALLRSSAKWRSKEISLKQKELIKKYISWGKIADDLDLNTMTGGDASAILDQINWGDLIIKLFGTNDRKKLKGYFSMLDDV